MFKFSLQSVLSLRNNTEEMKKRELGLLNLEKEKLNKEEQALELYQQQLLDEMQRHATQSIDLEALKHYNTYYPIVKKKRDELIKEIAKLNSRIEEKKVELSEAVKDRKILENLRAIQVEEYNQEQRRQESQLIDEIVTYKYSQKDRRE